MYAHPVRSCVVKYVLSQKIHADGQWETNYQRIGASLQAQRRRGTANEKRNQSELSTVIKSQNLFVNKQATAFSRKQYCWPRSWSLTVPLAAKCRKPGFIFGHNYFPLKQTGDADLVILSVLTLAPPYWSWPRWGLNNQYVRLGLSSTLHTHHFMFCHDHDHFERFAQQQRHTTALFIQRR